MRKSRFDLRRGKFTFVLETNSESSISKTFTLLAEVFMFVEFIWELLNVPAGDANKYILFF
jgi:hypothetical protein